MKNRKMLACLIYFIIAASLMGCGKKSQKTGNEYPDSKTFPPEYRVIMSQILCYDKNASIITKEEADQSITPGMTTKDKIINQFGSPVAVYTDVGDIIYYPTDIEGGIFASHLLPWRKKWNCTPL